MSQRKRKLRLEAGKRTIVHVHDPLATTAMETMLYRPSLRVGNVQWELHLIVVGRLYRHTVDIRDSCMLENGAVP